MAKSEIDARREYSDGVVSKFKSKLANTASLSNGCTVVVNGSFARREASPQSDVDYFILREPSVDVAAAIPPLQDAIARAIADENLQPPAAGGAFANSEPIDKFVQNVGGASDPNEKLTRRMLFMLEGEPLTDPALFYSYRERLVQGVYAKSDLDDHQITRFFLNDLIRYWRTIGVDFEFKTNEGNKPWGTRNLKLAFSRKLIYFSGLLMVAETAQRTASAKARILLDLAKKDPISRVEELCGAESEKALDLYDDFLSKLSDASFRQMADATTQDRKLQSEEFRDLKNRAQYFSWELDRVLHAIYVPSHPIHHALMF